MKITDKIKCAGFPCADMDKNNYIIPPAEIDTVKIKLIMITEAPPPDKADYFYAPGGPFYLKTTLEAFREAGAKAQNMKDILDLGVYITTAVKCAKSGLYVSPDAVKNCAVLLEKEVALFPNIKAFFLGGDIAIKMMNAIWKKQTGKRVVPTGATYKIRNQEHYLGDKRVFPSYTPAGKNILIEKGKMGVIAEDLRKALELIR